MNNVCETVVGGPPVNNAADEIKCYLNLPGFISRSKGMKERIVPKTPCYLPGKKTYQTG